MVSGLIQKTIWSVIQRFCPSIIQIVATLVITRFISPNDYGEVALVTTFFQICSLLVSSGLGEGLMYKSNCSNVLYDSVFYFNIVVAISLYAILFYSSSYIACFYDVPRLAILVKIISINLVIFSISYLQRIIFQKDLNFKLLAFSSLFSTVIGSIIGLLMAINGAGVWAIVTLTLTQNVIDTTVLWCMSSWRPRLQFSWSELKEIFSYSFRILSNNIVQVVYDNIYSLVLGKVFGSRSLGLYNRMQTVVYFTTTNFLYSLESLFFPVLCKDKNNQDYLRVAYDKLLRISMLLATFVLALIIVNAREIIIMVLTKRWADGVPVLQIISIAFIFVPISYINNSFLKIYNKTQYLLYGNILKKIIGVIILVATIATKHLEYVCIGIIVYNLIDAIISMILSATVLKIKFLEQLCYVGNSLFIIICVITISYFIPFNSNIYISFVEKTVLVIVIYFLYHILLKTVEYNILMNVLAEILRKKNVHNF